MMQICYSKKKTFARAAQSNLLRGISVRASDVLTFLSFFMRLNILPIRIKQTLFFPSYFGLVVLKVSRGEFLAKTFEGSNNCLARYFPQLFFNMYERLKAVVHLKFGGQNEKKLTPFLR